MKEKLFKLIVILGALLGIILMYANINKQLNAIHEDIKINLIGERNATCVPSNVNGKTIFECSHPSYYDLKDYLNNSN